MQTVMNESSGYLTRKKALDQLRSQLDNERSSFKAHWRDLNDYILPRRGRFFTSDINNGERRNLKIIDSSATLAVRTLRAGMMGGITSPARPWFKLSVSDPDLAEFHPVKQYLHEVTTRMQTIFLRSNLYNVLPITYGDVGVYGTGAMMLEEDFSRGIHCYSFPVGSYMIAVNRKQQVDTFFREFKMTVRQIVNTFGYDEMTNKINWDKIPLNVRQHWEKGTKETWVEVCHCIKPNENFKPDKLESRYKRFISIYYVKGTSGSSVDIYGDINGFLSEKGYDIFPVLVPRWEVTGEDSYGTDCPGMTALGDIKQLQKGESRGLQAIDKMINPPMTGPSSLRNQKATILPGDITYLDTREGQSGFRAAHEVRFDLQALEGKQDQVRQRISRAFYEDLFLMLAQSDRRQITATEIDERKEEKLLALGPVLEQLNQDLLDPKIDITFDFMNKQGLLPRPPDELAGKPLKVEYISIMAQAQKLVGLGGIERFTNFVGGMASIDPRVLHKINGDQIVDYYGDLTSIPPGIVRSDDEANAIREQEAQAQANAAKLQNMQAAAGTAKQLSETDINGESALSLIAGGNQ